MRRFLLAGLLAIVSAVPAEAKLFGRRHAGCGCEAPACPPAVRACSAPCCDACGTGVAWTQPQAGCATCQQHAGVVLNDAGAGNWTGPAAGVNNWTGPDGRVWTLAPNQAMPAAPHTSAYPPATPNAGGSPLPQGPGPQGP